LLFEKVLGKNIVAHFKFQWLMIIFVLPFTCTLLFTQNCSHQQMVFVANYCVEKTVHSLCNVV